MSEIKVATLNLFNRMGDWDRRASLVIDQLEGLDPDVIGFQEVNLCYEQGMWISRQINARRAERPHYRIKHVASPGKYASAFGLCTLAKVDVLEHEMLDFMTHDRVAQRLSCEKEGSQCVLVNTHLHHPPEAIQERVEQIERLLSWLDEDERRLPTILCGDFNALPSEPGVELLKGRFRSAHEAVHGKEPEKTWPTPVNTYDDSPHGTLDYVYVSEEFDVVDAGLAFDRPSPDDPDLFPSDHLGVYAVLRL